MTKTKSKLTTGDTFIAGMLFSRLERPEWDLLKQLAFSCELAGKKVARDGFDGLGETVRHHLVGSMMKQ